MEAAEPICETPELDEEINFIEEILINNKQKIYKIQLGIKERKKELVVKATNEDTKDIFYFQRGYTSQELQKFSKIFSFYETMKDLIAFLKNQNEKSKFVVEEKDKDLFIRFKVFLPDGKEKLINLELKKKSREAMDIIKYFYETIKNAKKDISSIENKMKSLEDKNKALEESNEFQKKEIKDCKNKINNLIESNKKMKKEIFFAFFIVFILLLPYFISLFKNNYSILIEENYLIKNEISNIKIENNLFKNEISNLKEENNFINNTVSNLIIGKKSIESNLKDDNNLIKNEISNLKDDNNLIKNEISNLKDDNNLIKNEISNLTGDKIQLNKKIYDLEKQYSKQAIENSKIIFSVGNYSHKNSINFIYEYLNYNTETFLSNIKLLYRSSIHGDNTKTLHELCDNKQNILIIIKSDSGYLFGGYSKIGFKTNNENKELIDNHSFLFSITKQKIYPVINNRPVICHYKNDFGFCFYQSIYFYDSFTKKNGNHISKLMKNNFNGISDIYEINGGKDDFKIEELEVYQLL